LKIALGTVQFGLDYGISNKNGVPNNDDLKSIFNIAKNSNISILDTANAYGNSEERLGEFSNNEFQIVTKFSKVNSEKELLEQLNNSLKKLKVDKIYGYLAHNADILIENPSFWNVLQEVKTENKIQKIGFSLYYPEQLLKLLELNCIPDLVQLPYSILDRKFEESLSILKHLGTEIHVRSVFLQGLYFMNPNNLPKNLLSFKSTLEEFNKVCEDNKVSIAATALNFVISNPNIDKVVIGVENANQLQSNIDMIIDWKPNEDLFLKIASIQIEDENLLNPSNW
jgi:aryl-alcohol dehydrogenase-like predicted oxidoreductase